MPIAVVCSSCRSSFKAPETAAGRKGKCPKCGAALTIPAAQDVPAAGPRPVVAEAPAALAVNYLPTRPLARAESGGELIPREPEPRPLAAYTDCPFCGEDVLAKAKKCKHCGEVLDVALRAAEEAKRESRREPREGRGDTNVRQTTQIVVQNNRPGFNHGIHIALDIFTCGAWLPIHLLCWALHN